MNCSDTDLALSSDTACLLSHVTSDCNCEIELTSLVCFIFQDGARIADSVSRGRVASTYEKGSWITLGDLTGKTVSCMHEASDIDVLLISVVFFVVFL